MCVHIYLYLLILKELMYFCFGRHLFFSCSRVMWFVENCNSVKVMIGIEPYRDCLAINK